MRLWSIHPKYLDQKGLCGLWREALLAQDVLLKGEFSEHPQTPHTRLRRTPYYNHPQLERFKNCERPLDSIGRYLLEIYVEAEVRGYNFNSNKIKGKLTPIILTVTQKQLDYEYTHLQTKLKERDYEKYNDNVNLTFQELLLKGEEVKAHPLFKVVEGNIETWEKIK